MKASYVKTKLQTLINVSKIVTIHYYEFDRNFVFHGESHDFWEMVYIDSGSVDITANNKEFHLNQGEIIFHKPNEFHTIRTDEDVAANAFVISFVCSSDAMQFFKGKTMLVPSKLRKYISTITEEYFQTFESMAPAGLMLELKENPAIGGQQMIKTSLEQLLIMLIRSENTNADSKVFPTKESMENHLVSQAIQIITENIYGKVSVAQICNELNYSRTYLSKIFKAATGYTILDYFILSKIREAKKLIREERYNFTQISDLLAFNNPHYFSAVFKKFTNMTPSDYKNSVIKS